MRRNLLGPGGRRAFTPEGTINEALIKMAGNEGYEKMVVDTAMGKSAITDYRVIDAAGPQNRALCRC